MSYPKRPTRYDAAIKRQAVEAILPAVKSWFRDKPPADECLLRDLQRCADTDAYEFAKRLDEHGWCPDAELVEVLTGYDTYGAHHLAVREWVSANAVAVPYSLGDVVKLRGQSAKIVDIRAATAEIIAQPTVPDGHNYGATGGWVHAFEDASPTEVAA